MRSLLKKFSKKIEFEPEVPKIEDSKAEEKPPDPEKAAAKKEKERILALVLSKAAPMASDYRHSIKRTEGLLSSSMAYAYAKGIQDVIKLLAKEGK